MKNLARELINRMPELTARKSVELALANSRINHPFIKRTVMDLVNLQSSDESQSALVIGAGPSIHRRDSVEQIIASGYKGTIICADGALGHCLRKGLVPDYVVTVDPGPGPTGQDRILRWFGDPNLNDEKLAKDDYFRRQDLDEHIGVEELKRNKEMLDLVDRYAPKMKAVISTSAPPGVTQRCIAAGMELYWWNPLYDDFDAPDSVTAQIYRENKVPCLVTGGNCGAAAWVLAHAVLGKSDIAILGMDFSYAPGTPLLNTQYFNEIEAVFGNMATDAFIEVLNPYLNETWFTDPAYYWYRETFLDMATKADCSTYNCTEGGILFGDGVEFISLQEFFAAHPK